MSWTVDFFASRDCAVYYILSALHYAKAALVFGNVLLCLTLLGRNFVQTRRRSLLLIFAGLATIGISVLISNYVLTSDLLARNREPFQAYSAVFFSTVLGAGVVCEIGLGWELATLFRRRSSPEQDR